MRTGMCIVPKASTPPAAAINAMKTAKRRLPLAGRGDPAAGRRPAAALRSTTPESTRPAHHSPEPSVRGSQPILNALSGSSQDGCGEPMVASHAKSSAAEPHEREDVDESPEPPRTSLPGGGGPDGD